MATKTTRKMTTGYAETSTRRNMIEPETVIVGETECEAKFIGERNANGAFKWGLFKLGRRYYRQLLHNTVETPLGHTRYTIDDLEKTSSWDGLWIDAASDDLIDSPMWYHKRGLTQTATGYGKKLNTGKKIDFEGKERRVYCCCFSNSGTCYFYFDGKEILIR